VLVLVLVLVALALALALAPILVLVLLPVLMAVVLMVLVVVVVGVRPMQLLAPLERRPRGVLPPADCGHAGWWAILALSLTRSRM